MLALAERGELARMAACMIGYDAHFGEHFLADRRQIPILLFPLKEIDHKGILFFVYRPARPMAPVMGYVDRFVALRKFRYGIGGVGISIIYPSRFSGIDGEFGLDILRCHGMSDTYAQCREQGNKQM